MTTEECSRCAGCGRVADGPDGEPWTYWEQMPMRNALAVIVGLVKPVPCPNCLGTGLASAEGDAREIQQHKDLKIAAANLAARTDLGGERQ